nr:tigger transposable element-derived protein 1-like [Onthophagus taurus]
MSATKQTKRKAISLEVKINILDNLANGDSATTVGQRFGLRESTVRTIKKNEDAIRKSVIAGTKLSAHTTSYTRDIVKQKMEKALVIWMEDMSQKRIPVDGNNIKQMALKIYNQIKEAEPQTSGEKRRKFEFSASTGWMNGFLQRHALHNIKIKDEIASADDVAAKEFPAKLAKIIEKGGYTPDQVWNADETGLFWKRMPNRTYVAKSQKTASGFKAAKDRVTFLFCSNASGDRMLKPLLVNRALKPRSMKGVNLDTLSVHWTANKKAWVTREIFNEWFVKHFIPEVRRYMSDKSLEFKVLLIIDNAPGHPHIEHPNVEFCFLPPNTTSLIQPLDQGIIATFKTYYVKQTFRYILDKLTNNKNVTVIDAWKNFTINDCIKHAGLALSELKPSTLNACWRSLWPECVKNKDHVPSNMDQYPNITALAHEIGGEGFADISSADIDELLEDKALTDDEIISLALEIPDDKECSEIDEEIPTLTADVIKEGLQLAAKLCDHFQKHDPIEERSTKFQRDIKLLMGSYRELYNSLIKPGTQRSITEFVTRTTNAAAQLEKESASKSDSN